MSTYIRLDLEALGMPKILPRHRQDILFEDSWKES